MLGDVGWIDSVEPPDAWLEATEQRGGLLSVNHPIGGHVSWTAAHDAPAAADRGLALELARSALDQFAGLVACLGSGRDPGRRQRLAPAWFGRTARLAHHLGRSGSGGT